jgi:asparagine synthetase B (glutamine-hydrolysing)
MSYIKSLSEIEQWGYYEVNNKKYFLLREAYEQVTHVNQIKFNFHDDWFMRMNTSVEPTQSLDELYRQRVQQIRKKYDYVVLAYSGGADSHNILKYFELLSLHLLNFRKASY